MNNGGMIYELPIAQVRIIKGKSFIDGTQITDERTFVIYRGKQDYMLKQVTEKKAPIFYNDWTDMRPDDPRNPLRYFIDGFGLYHVEGMCGNGVYGDGKVICKFPLGPERKQSVFAWGQMGNCNI